MPHRSCKLDACIIIIIKTPSCKLVKKFVVTRKHDKYINPILASKLTKLPYRNHNLIFGKVKK